MKTTSYNPSSLEVEFVKALESLSKEIEAKLDDLRIDKIECDTEADNPFLKFHFCDEDNDPHEVVVKIIQLPDKNPE